MSFLPDRVLAHLVTAAGRPDLSGTRYVLEEEIGRGGMGQVFRARDTLLGRDVALKVTDGDGSPLLSSEPGLLARLEHPGIIPIYDAGDLADGRRYYAMRLVRGTRLDEFAAMEPSLPGRLRVFLRVCETVAFAHKSGVIHRDLKPQNIMAGEFGQVFVLDWGIARETGSAAAAIAGTPRYMPPEPAEQSGERFDVYSLGRVLEDLMGGQRPAPLAAVAARASAPEAVDRYARVEELREDVARFLDRLPVTAYREAPLERLARFAARNRVLLLLLGAYLAVRFALFFVRP